MPLKSFESNTVFQKTYPQMKKKKLRSFRSNQRKTVFMVLASRLKSRLKFEAYRVRARKKQMINTVKISLVMIQVSNLDITKA